MRKMLLGNSAPIEKFTRNGSYSEILGNTALTDDAPIFRVLADNISGPDI